MSALDPEMITTSPLAALRGAMSSAHVRIFLATALVHVGALVFAPPPTVVEAVVPARFAELLARVEPINTTADRFVTFAYLEPSPLPIEPPAAPEPEEIAPVEVAQAEAMDPTPLRNDEAAREEPRLERTETARTAAQSDATPQPPVVATVAPVVTSDAGDAPTMGEAATSQGGEAAPVLVASADDQNPGIAPVAATRGSLDAPAAGSAANTEALARYSTRASQRIAAALRYTAEMRSAGVHGNVVLAVVINDDGEIIDVRVERSSGIELIDEAAVADLRRLGRLPAPPRDSGIGGRTLLLPASYSIPS